MIPFLPTNRELEQLFQDQEDGVIDPSDRLRLMNLLRHSPALRHAYLEHMAVAAGLHGLAKEWGENHELVPVRQTRKISRWFLATAAAAVVAILAVWGLSGRQPQNSGTLAKVIAGADTSWRFEAGGIGENGDFLPDTKLVVDQGTLEIITRTQSRYLLQGASVLEIHDSLHASLTAGKGWFDMAPSDKGFSVITGRSRVTDFGTRFGIATNTGTSPEEHVQVGSGKVRLESRAPGAAALDLTTGQAASSGADGHYRVAPYQPGLFVERLPGPKMIHWSFDHEEGGEFPSDSDGIQSFTMKVKGFGAAEAKAGLLTGRFGSALDLQSGDVFAESDFPGISGPGPRTVAFWIKGEAVKGKLTKTGERYIPSILTWGDPTIDGAAWSVRVNCYSGPVGTQWGRRGLVTAGKSTLQKPLDGGWHHIASVCTGNIDASRRPEIKHYIDGKLVQTANRDNMTRIKDGPSEIPGSKVRLNYDPAVPGGPSSATIAIDEVWILASALTDHQIEALYLANEIPEER
ncbi:MAG: hypothetical protein ABIS50_18440 [Luteolibacter sp.]|uniref:hypothetical protein n=1 Tax=Luteolibacter sp. TaxID=1962973 RepID=UPI0032661588